MAEGYFTEAASLMREGGLDPREVFSSQSFCIIEGFRWVLVSLLSVQFLLTSLLSVFFFYDLRSQLTELKVTCKF